MKKECETCWHVAVKKGFCQQCWESLKLYAEIDGVDFDPKSLYPEIPADVIERFKYDVSIIRGI
jgi:hypothetical protein